MGAPRDKTADVMADFIALLALSLCVVFRVFLSALLLN
jgi:hypothetical protein